MNVLEGDSVAQLAHVGWGGLLCFILRHFFPNADAMLAVAAFSVSKEASEALGIAFWEPKQTWGSSAIDALFFFVGIGVFAIFK